MGDVENRPSCII